MSLTCVAPYTYNFAKERKSTCSSSVQLQQVADTAHRSRSDVIVFCSTRPIRELNNNRYCVHIAFVFKTQRNEWSWDKTSRCTSQIYNVFVDGGVFTAGTLFDMVATLRRENEPTRETPLQSVRTIVTRLGHSRENRYITVSSSQTVAPTVRQVVGQPTEQWRTAEVLSAYGPSSSGITY
jgi:hypothetical protein